MIETLGLVAGSGWASGLNIYLVTLMLGLGGRAGWTDIPEVLQRPDVLIVAGVLYLIEFAADKIPYLDNVWDALHTFVRPLGAAALGFVIAGESSSIGGALGAVVSGSLALSAHSAKATTRAAVNTSPEPFSNIFLSLFEDGLVAGLVALAVLYPVARRLTLPWLRYLAVSTVLVSICGDHRLSRRTWCSARPALVMPC